VVKKVEEKAKVSSGALNKRPVPRSGKAQAYDQKAITGKRKSYVGK